MTVGPIIAVMIHVADTEAALAWYKSAFPAAIRRRVEGHHFEYLELDGVRIEFVPEDDKVSAGPAGTVVYWSASGFESSLVRLQSLGATLYRGPMNIEDGFRMCQVQDPWGNCLGIRGK